MTGFPYTVGDVAAFVGARLSGDPSVRLDRVVIDSRQDLTGALFVALAGERFDGHDFVAQAVDNGAAAVLVSGTVSEVPIPILRVNDTLAALTCFAAVHRSAFRGTVAAITGSCGKTTTRALLVAILSVSYRVHQPVRNFNNHIGVPLTLLGLRSVHEMGVFEIGCSGFGEIAPLTDLVMPDVALVTNVGPAHLENLGDLDGVFREKGELFGHMPHHGTAVVNIDDPYVRRMTVSGARHISYGNDPEATIRLLERIAAPYGQQLRISVCGQTLEVRFPLPGRHNAQNALAAAAMAVALEIPSDVIRTGLEAVQPVSGRLQILSIRGLVVIDDTYNANPASVAAALEVLSDMASSQNAIAVLGDMLELGAQSQQAHFDIGRAAAQSGLKALVLMGAFRDETARGAMIAGMSADRIYHASDAKQAVDILQEISVSEDALLIKGSRGMRMEEILSKLREEG